MTTPDSRLPEDFSNQAEDAGNRGLLLTLLLGMAALLLVGLYVFFLPQDEVTLEPPLDPASIDPIIRAQMEAAKQPQAPQPASQPDRSRLADTPQRPRQTLSEPQRENPSQDLATLVKPAADKPEVPLALPHAGDTARKLIKSVRQGDKALSLDQLYQQASELQSGDKATDAYLLYFYAARQGHGPSAFALGSMNDPAHFSGASDMLEKPDPAQAYKWYSIAALNQVAGSEARLQALRSRIETASAAGDPGAQRLLLNWK